MDRAQVVELLLESNSERKRAQIVIYADAFLDYQEAVANIREHGNIVLHPRTAAPIDNPYIRVKSGAVALLTKQGKGLNTRELWEAVELEAGQPGEAAGE